MKAKFNQQHKAVLDALLLNKPGVTAGRMFGYPAYYAGKKMCVCLYEQGVGVKLPADTVSKLLETDKNSVPFQPMGRPKMKEWIQINLTDSEAYRNYESLFQQSVDFLLAQQ